MRPQVHSPRMALGRQIALLAALVAGLFALAGCGGDDSSSAEIDPEVAELINAKLDQVQERAADGKCTGDNSAESALTSLQADVPELLAGEDEEFVSDLTEMLDQLGEQIADQCEEDEEPKTTSTSTPTTTTDTEPPPTTTEETTTDETKETTSTTQSTTPEPPDDPQTPPPGGGGTPGGGPPTGGQPGGSGGFTPGDRAAKQDKKPKHHGKPKDEKK